MSRVFLMKWYHFSVEYFEDLRNVNHCEFLIMRKKEDSGKYILENNLRTWSELKRERAAASAAATKSAVSEKDQEKERKLLGNGTGTGETSSSSGVGSPIPVRKKWGGCPNGCDHGKHSYRKENSMHAMELNGKASSVSPAPGLEVTPASSSSLSSLGGTQTLQMRRPGASRRWQSSSEEDEDDPRGRAGPPAPFAVDVNRSLDELVSSPDGTPTFITVEDRLKHRVKSPRADLLGLGKSGRDFGGSMSGQGSDADLSAEEDLRKHVATGGKTKGPSAAGAGRSSSGMGHGAGGWNGKAKDNLRGHRGALADALGDQSDVGSDAGMEDEPELSRDADLESAEKKDKSLKGSVY